jgi:hypothetical protein
MDVVRSLLVGEERGSEGERGEGEGEGEGVRERERTKIRTSE